MKSVFLLVALVVIAACGGSGESSTQDEQQDELQSWQVLEQEVMEIHDEVMPKMGDMNNMRKKLLEINASRELADSTRAAVIKTIQDLETADSLMWQWMYDYSRPSGDSPADALQYLEKEKVRVTRVKDAINSSMAEASKLIEQNDEN